MKHLKLYEDWFDHLSNHPANQVDPVPNKRSKNKPFHYVFDNEYIIIVEMEGNKYYIDLLNLEKTNPDLYKQLAEDYVGVNQVYSGIGKGHEMESDFESSDIHNLNDIDAEHIVSWLNDEYPNIDETLIEINDELKDELINDFKELKQII